MGTIHNPASFDPAAYEVIDYFDNRRPQYYGQGVEAWEDEIKYWKQDLANTYGEDWVKKIHSCVHCGNSNVRWITAVRHLPTGDVLTFGADCTMRLNFSDKHSFKLARLKARADANAARLKVWGAREAFLATRPEFAAALESLESDPVHAKNFFAKDVASKLNRFGSLSDRQVAAVLASMSRDREFAAKRSAEAAEVKGEAPEGRVQVEGVVVSVKDRETDFGVVTKMLIKLDNNAKVWLTRPSKLDAYRGDRVRVTATFTRSHDDKSFAFGSRPSNYSVVAMAADAAVA